MESKQSTALVKPCADNQELVMKAKDLRDLTGGQRKQIAAIANSPPPAWPEIITPDQLRQLLKLIEHKPAKRADNQAGKEMVAAYWLALKDQPYQAVKYAAEYANKHEQWRPDPARMHTLCQQWPDPERQVWKVARALVRDYKQKRLNDIEGKIKRRELDANTLQKLPKGVLERQLGYLGSLARSPAGKVSYKAREED